MNCEPPDMPIAYMFTRSETHTINADPQQHSEYTLAQFVLNYEKTGTSVENLTFSKVLNSFADKNCTEKQGRIKMYDIQRIHQLPLDYFEIRDNTSVPAISLTTKAELSCLKHEFVHDGVKYVWSRHNATYFTLIEKHRPDKIIASLVKDGINVNKEDSDTIGMLNIQPTHEHMSSLIILTCTLLSIYKTDREGVCNDNSITSRVATVLLTFLAALFGNAVVTSGRKVYG
jgi:hypothetical protein